MKFASLLISLAFTFSAYAGDNGGGYISCVSASGKTRIEGTAGAEYNGWGFATLKYSIEGYTLDFDPTKPLADKNGPVFLVDFVSFEYGKSYNVVIKRVQTFENESYNNRIFELNSTPGTWKKFGTDMFRFTAVVRPQSLDPRLVKELASDYLGFDKPITVTCELDVSL